MAFKNWKKGYKKKAAEPKGPPMEQEAFIAMWMKNAGLTLAEATVQGYKCVPCPDCKSPTCKGWHIVKA